MAVCSSLDSGAEEFRVTGGGVKDYPFSGIDAGMVKTLTSTGKDMYAEVLDAVANHSIMSSTARQAISFFPRQCRLKA